MWHWIFLPRAILVEQNCLPLNLLLLDFERKLRRILRKGDIDDITNELSQRALTKCDTNALLMAMEVGHEKNKIFVYLLFVLVNSSLLIYSMCCSYFFMINNSSEDMVWKLTTCPSVFHVRDMAIIASLSLTLEFSHCHLSSFITERYASGAPNDGFLQNTMKKLFRPSRVLLDLCQIQTRNLLNQRPFLPPPYCHR